MSSTAATETNDQVAPKTSALGNFADYIEEATSARQEYERAGKMYAALTFLEARLETQRPGLKLEAIKRLMAQENPLAKPDGFGGRPHHSASSAEAIVETDEEYAKHLQLQRETVRDKNHARTRMESAYLRTETALAAVRAIAGLIR